MTELAHQFNNNPNDNCTVTFKERFCAVGADASILADIYSETTNIAIWQRSLSSKLVCSAQQFMIDEPNFQIAMSVAPRNISRALSEEMGAKESALISDITELSDMFAYLFELKKVGLRLRVLDVAMCPKFHVDKVPARLITTYHGVATEWLSHNVVNRCKLGLGASGQADDKSGLYDSDDDIQQLSVGQVALLKGESWQGNEGAGLVHRSPTLAANQRRLLLTIDFAD